MPFVTIISHRCRAVKVSFLLRTCLVPSSEMKERFDARDGFLRHTATHTKSKALPLPFSIQSVVRLT